VPLWVKNLTRTLTVGGTVGIAFLLGDTLPSFLGVLGSLSGAPMSFFFPALIHYKLFYNEMTQWQRFGDLAVMVLAIVIMIFGTFMGIANW